MHLKCSRAFSHERQQRAPSARFDGPLGVLEGEDEAENRFWRRFRKWRRGGSHGRLTSNLRADLVRKIRCCIRWSRRGTSATSRLGAAYLERRFGSWMNESLTGILRHFRPVMRNFYYFRVGVFGGPEVAGGVVDALAWPEVGAAYQKSAEALFSVREGVAGDDRE